MTKTTLKDIAGYEKIKDEGAMLIDILKNTKKYTQEGAFIPKGLLLSGDAGVGKTMFARAIVNESGSKVFTLDGGAAKNDNNAMKEIKEVFTEAKKNAPCILFIDEVEQYVNDNGFHPFESDQSRAMTKFMLTEIDGLSNTDGVFIICTTNDIDALPDAFIRSGRMDKKIRFKLPNAREREQILAYYIGKNPSKFDSINIGDLAKVSNGFTGADLKSAINNALLESIANGNPVYDESIIRKFDEIRCESIDQSVGEPEDRVVYHELGHAVAQLILNKEYSQVGVNDIGPTKGLTIFEQEKDKGEADDLTFSKLRNNIVVSLAGEASEEVFFGEDSAGCAADMKKAIGVAKDLFKCGAYGFDSFQIIPGPGGYGFSIDFTKEGMKQYAKIMDEAKEKALSIIKEYRPLIEAIAPTLKKRRMLSSSSFRHFVEKESKKLGLSI